MRLAMRIGALFYALSYAHSLRMGARSMRIAGASKGVGGVGSGGRSTKVVSGAGLSVVLPLPSCCQADRLQAAEASAARGRSPHSR